MHRGNTTSDVDLHGAEFIDISVLGGFSVSVDGRPVTGLPVGSQRLLVFLALQDRTVSRNAVAAAMWPNTTAEHAGESLRSALSRLEGLGREAIVAESAALGLTDVVNVDYVEANALAHRLLDSDTPIFDGDLAAAAIATLSRELLPDWDDDWIIAESEEWRHLRATALKRSPTGCCSGTLRRGRKRRSRGDAGGPAARDAAQHLDPHPPRRRQPVGCH